MSQDHSSNHSNHNTARNTACNATHDEDAENIIRLAVRELMQKRAATGFSGESLIAISWKVGEPVEVRVTDEVIHRLGQQGKR